MPGDDVARLQQGVVVQQPSETLRSRPAAPVAHGAPAPAPPAAPPLAKFPSYQGSPFGAVAALLAGSLARAEQSGGTYAHVDVWRQAPWTATQPGGAAAAAEKQRQQQPVLVLEDDAAGLSPQQLRRSIGVPMGDCCRSDSAASRGPRGSTWPGFVHAVLRLGSAALVLTKRKGPQGGASAALLLCHAEDSGGKAGVVAALVDWTPDGGPLRAAATQGRPGGGSTPATSACDWPTALAAVCRGWPGGCTHDWLLQQLAAMPEQGTRVLVTSMRCSSGSGGGKQGAVTTSGGAPEAAAAAAPAAAAAVGDGAFELDWESDQTDIRAAPAAGWQRSEQPGASEPPTPAGPALWRRPAVHSSLRAFLSLLFLRWPDGFRLRLRGCDVAHCWQQLTSDTRQWAARATEEYRPRGVKEAVDEHGYLMQHIISLQLGTVACDEGQQGGICFYHSNRLVRAFWRPSSWPAPCAAVLGFLESDALTPSQDWQDFEPCPVLQKLEAFVKRTVPAYRERHALRAAAAVPVYAAQPRSPHALPMQQWEAGQQPWLSTLSVAFGLGAVGARTTGAVVPPPPQLDAGALAALAAAAAAQGQPAAAPDAPLPHAHALHALLPALLPGLLAAQHAPAPPSAGGNQQAFNQLLLQTLAQLMQALHKYQEQQAAMQQELASLRHSWQLVMASAPLLAGPEQLVPQAAHQPAAQPAAAQQHAAQQQLLQLAQQAAQQQAAQQQQAALQALHDLAQQSASPHARRQPPQQPQQEAQTAAVQTAALSLLQCAQQARAADAAAGAETNARKRTRLD